MTAERSVKRMSVNVSPQSPAKRPVDLSLMCSGLPQDLHPGLVMDESTGSNKRQKTEQQQQPNTPPPDVSHSQDDDMRYSEVRETTSTQRNTNDDRDVGEEISIAQVLTSMHDDPQVSPRSESHESKFVVANI